MTLDALNRIHANYTGIGQDTLEQIEDDFETIRAALKAHRDASEWLPIETAPKDGSVFYVQSHYRIPFKWKKYKPNSQQFKRGIKGRWQEMNEYGGWENSNKKPDQWQEDKQSERGE
jgi:hypothetical protein